MSDEFWYWAGILSGPLIGALIGWLTNALAVRMLFHPYKPIRIGRARLPLTPGIIPRRRHELAEAIGRAVEEKLLTYDDLSAALDGRAEPAGNPADADTCACETGKTDGLRLCELPHDPQDLDALLTLLTDRICERIGAALDAPEVQKMLEDRLVYIVLEQVQGTMFGMFLNEKSIRTLVNGRISSALLNITDDDPLAEEPLHAYVRAELETLSEKELGEILAGQGAGGDAELFGRLKRDLLLRVSQNLLGKIHVAAIVTAKIDAMPMRELEDLVLSVMRRELRAVVNLGALLGFLIGLINIFV